MTASEQVVEALRARAAELAPVSRSLANKREREYCLALADFVEAAQEMRDHFPLVFGGTRYDAALKRLAEVLR